MSARRKTEAAMVAVIKDYYAGEVYAGTRGDVKEHPCVVCVASDGEEMPLGSGNTALTVTVSVQDQIDEQAEPLSTDRFDAAVEAVGNALRYDDLDAQLSGKVLNFHCIGVMGRSGPTTDYDDQNDLIAETFTINLLIAEADL